MSSEFSVVSQVLLARDLLLTLETPKFMCLLSLPFENFILAVNFPVVGHSIKQATILLLESGECRMVVVLLRGYPAMSR